MAIFRRIVAPVDFSDTARDALRLARDLAHNGDIEVHVLHVVPNIWHQPLNVDEPFLDNAAMERQWIERADRRLAQLLAEEDLREHVTSVAIVGAPAAVIVQYADEHEADLIVMGAHGSGPVHRFLLGSVADRVSRSSTCPILIVPHGTLRMTPRLSAQAVERAS